MTITVSFNDNNAVGGSGGALIAEVLKSILRYGYCYFHITVEVVFGAVDDVMPTAYGESFDILEPTTASATTGTSIFTQLEVQVQTT